MTSILDGALERGPFAGEGGRTGASFERAVLADGTAVVIKHVRSDDWTPTLTGDVGRLCRLWEDGVFARVPAPIDHATVAIEPFGDGIIIVMHDYSDAFLGDDRVLSRAENRRVLEAVDALHAEFWGEQVEGVMDVHDRFDVMSPKGISRFADVSPVAPLVIRGWELFADVAPSDVTEAVYALLEDPGPLTRELASRPQTLIHGDLRLHNLGLTPEKIVLFDWEVIGTAPPAVEIGWYLIIGATRIDATREQILHDYRDVAGERYDGYTMELGLIGGMLWLGWNKALDIVENPDPAIRAQERADLDWWIARIRIAFEAWSPKSG
jgi:hypothetical protein